MPFAPATIPIPSYLFSDDELLLILIKLGEMDNEMEESEQACPRAAACVAAIRTELTKRGSPISLRD